MRTSQHVDDTVTNRPALHHSVLLAVATGVVVFGWVWVGVVFTRGSGQIATIWFANAIALAILLRCRTRSWSSVLVGCAIGNLLAAMVAGEPLALAAGLTGCDILEILLVAVPLRRWAPYRLDLTRLKQLAAFALFAGVLAPALAGVAAVLVFAVHGGGPKLSIWTAWYPADALGYLTVTPLLLLLRLDDLRALLAPTQWFKTLAWLTVLVAVTAVVFVQTTYPLLFLPMAVLGLIAVQLGPAGTSLGIGLVALAAIVATIDGRGPMMLISGDFAPRILVLQIFLAVTFLTKLPVVAILSDRARLATAVRDANDRLRLAEKIAEVGHWHFNRSTQVLTWSDGVYRMYGFDPATYAPTLDAAISAYHPDDRVHIQSILRRAIDTGGEYDFALRLIRSDGAVRDVVSRGLCEKGLDGRVMAVFGTIMDVTELRQAERAIAESEARYRLLAENTTDMITQMDLTGRRLYVSPGSYGLLGYQPEDLVGTNPQDMIHPDDAVGVQARFAELASGTTDHLSSLNRLRHKDGHWVWVEASLKVLRDAERRPSGYVASIRNVTDRKAAEDALRDSETRYRLLADNATDMISYMDLTGRRLFVSPACRELFGYEPEELVGTDPPAMIHPDDVEAFTSLFFTLASGEKNQVAFTYRMQHRECRWIWVETSGQVLRNVDGSPKGVVATVRNVTARKLAEEALQDSETRYRLLADNVSDLIILGHRDGRRSYISPAVKSMLGYSVDEAHRVGMRDWVHPDDLTAVFAQTSGLSQLDPTATGTFRLKHKSGRYIWAEAAFRLVSDNDNGTVITAIRDVTERVRQARSLERAKVAAEAGAKAKAEFLANMSHELRTPLTGMLGLYDLLENDPALQARQRHFIALARDSGESLLAIVNDILDFSKIEAGLLSIESVSFSPREVVESCRDLCSQTIRQKNIILETDIHGDLPDLVRGDPTRIRQILLNLVTNAIKFTTKGRVKVVTSWADGLLRIDVIDTGIGIAADVIPRLFERFTQADGSTARRFGGAGLGLSISKHLVELMDGHIGVESRLGQGSTFWVTLPLRSVERGSNQTVVAPETPGAAPAVRRILLAEDNVINQEIIREILTQKGYSVTVAGDGADAIEAFTTADFDIVLMDVQMPGTDGLSATITLRAWERAERRSPTPIIALTANAMAEETERCNAAGMDTHVAKPIDWPALLHKIETLCRTPRRGDSLSSESLAWDSSRFVTLDEATLDALATFLSRDRISGLLDAFRQDTERRLALLDQSAATAADLSDHAHAFVAQAGHLGFVELSELCAELQRTTSTKGLATLREVARRALTAAATSSYADAA